MTISAKPVHIAKAFPGSAVALDDQLVSRVIELVGARRPDLAAVLRAAADAGTDEALDRLVLEIAPDDQARVMDVVRLVLGREGLFLNEQPGRLSA